MADSKGMQEDIMKFQQFQQQLQVLTSQKQTVQIQISEIDNAISELDNYKDKEVFEVIGTVMVKKEKDGVLTSLKDKKEIFDLRISTIDKQLEKLNEKSKQLQEKFTQYVDTSDKDKKNKTDNKINK